jgi:ABC-type transport system substrate-binding protein
MAHHYSKSGESGPLVRKSQSAVDLVRTVAIAVAVIAASSALYFQSGIVHEPVGENRATELATGNRIINVGVVDMMDNLWTLNPLLAATTAERMIIWPCYSTLLMYDPNGGLVGDLATSWELSSDGLSWHFSLSRIAVFFDKDSSPSTHTVVAQDVIYTYWLVQNQTNSFLNPCLVTATSQKIIQEMWAPDDFEIYINTTAPYAPMEDAFTSIPILPEYIWSTRVWNWNNYGSGVAACVGSGPFFYALSTFRTYPFVSLNKSLSWFQESERGWRIQVDQVRYWDYLSASNAWTDLASNPQQIDIMLGVSRSTYLNDLPAAQNITGWDPESGNVCALDVNQMTTSLRASLGGIYASGSNNQLLLNKTVKRALGMCINRTAFVTDSFGGLATAADSMLTDASPWYFGNPSPLVFDPEAARSLLVANGWSYNSSGGPANSTTVPLCREGGTSPLEFDLMTSAAHDEYIQFVLALATSAGNAGVKLNVLVASDSLLAGRYYKGDYDLGFWHYSSRLTADPSSGIFSGFTTMQIGTGNWIYYTNSSFDQLFNESVNAVDPSLRGPVIDQMQVTFDDNLSCQPVAYERALYAANNRTWINYGNWTEQPLLAPDQALPWLYLRIELRNDAPHDLSISYEPATPVAGGLVWCNGSAFDDNGDALTYFWDFGDSTNATGQEVTHDYSLPGSYVVTLNVTDSYGHESSLQKTIDVGPAIPEFISILVPVFGLLLAVILIARRR